VAEIRVLLWLPGARDDPALTAAQQRPLQGRLHVVTWRPAELITGSALPEVADRIAADLDEPVAVYGAGLGALVALHLAGRHPAQVLAAVLATNLRATPAVVRSVWSAAVRLLPGSTVRALGLGTEGALAVLDQARPVDLRPLTKAVECPVAVVCGEDDRVNRPASTALSRRLPQGHLELVPRAGPGWAAQRPAVVGEVLLRFLVSAGLLDSV
jgi:pimeloyl-ACP methyl ester carboxylesterase